MRGLEFEPDGSGSAHTREAFVAAESGVGQRRGGEIICGNLAAAAACRFASAQRAVEVIYQQDFEGAFVRTGAPTFVIARWMRADVGRRVDTRAIPDLARRFVAALGSEIANLSAAVQVIAGYAPGADLQVMQAAASHWTIGIALFTHTEARRAITVETA